MKTIYLSILIVFCFVVFLQKQLQNHNALEFPRHSLSSELNNVSLYGSNFIGKPILFKTKTEDQLFDDLSKTNGLAFDNNGFIYVVEHSKSQIVTYDEDGSILKTVKVSDGYPLHIIKSYHSNDMIFTNVTDHSVNKLSEDGTITKLYKGYPLHIPVGLSYDNKGILHISNHENKKVFALKDGSLKHITTLHNNNNNNKSNSCKKEK